MYLASGVSCFFVCRAEYTGSITGELWDNWLNSIAAQKEKCVARELKVYLQTFPPEYRPIKIFNALTPRLYLSGLRAGVAYCCLNAATSVDYSRLITVRRWCAPCSRVPPICLVCWCRTKSTRASLHRCWKVNVCQNYWFMRSRCRTCSPCGGYSLSFHSSLSNSRPRVFNYGFVPDQMPIIFFVLDSNIMIRSSSLHRRLAITSIVERIRRAPPSSS